MSGPEEGSSTRPERFGPRPVLIGLAGLGLSAGLILATARAPALVVLAAMLGNVALSGGDSGPFMSIEQVLVTIDPHSPPKFRVNGPLSNYNEFWEAFSCSEGTNMHPAKPCEVW